MDIKADIRTILDGFERGVFVRDISHDNEPGWALYLLPYLNALARLDFVVNEESEDLHSYAELKDLEADAIARNPEVKS